MVISDQNSSYSFIDGRGGYFCRGCRGENLFSGLDLGKLPIANELLPSQDSKIEKFPLHLRICIDCGLGQVADVVTPERIFRDYRYLSSISTTFLQHAAEFVETLVDEKMFDTEDWVLEIASNDGYLLKNFLKYEIGNNPQLEALIHTALEDNGLRREIPLLPGLLEQTDIETVELYKKLRFNKEFRREMIMRAWTKIPDFDIWKDRLDVSKHAYKITCPVAIIHGKDDVVIPSSESVLMHSLMKNYNHRIHLELSNLLDHGDMKIGFSILRDISKLAKAFGYFLENVG